jgi:hypothetical protein
VQDNNKITTEIGKVLSSALAGSAGGPGGVPRGVPLVIASAGVDGQDGTAPGTGAALSDAIAQNTAALTQVRGSVQAQLEMLANNTRALVENTSKQGVGSKIGGVAGSWASSMLGGGILGPVVSGLVGLFGGDKQETTPSATKFVMPAALRVDAGFQGTNIAPLDYGQNERPRMATATPIPQVTVNVTAMDSRSFMDHSGEIANAVRRAMLESNALNDVIGEM